MKKQLTGIILIFALVLGLGPSFAFASTAEPKVEAKAAILVDMNSGEVLYEKNADARNFPASTTKMMTCLLALETLQPDGTVTADSEAAATKGNGIELKEGETMTVDTILHAMMIPSANDCACAVAKACAGSVDSFAVMMNARAQELGCTGTNFVNPHGLHDENHYTTARDLSIIALECMKNESFREIVKNSEYTVPATNKSAARQVSSTNLLLNDTQDKNRIYVGNQLRYCKYEGTIGIKTGYTGAAGGCLVSACKRGDTSLLCVVLASSDLGRFADTIKIFDWGFENYVTRTVLRGGHSFGNVKVKHGEFNKVEAVLLSDVSYTMPAEASLEGMHATAVLEESLTAPVKKGDVIGTITLYDALDNAVATYQAVAAKSIAEGGFLSYFGIEDAAAEKIAGIAKVVFFLLVMLMAAYVITMRRKTRIKKANRARKLREKQEQEAARRAEWERYYESSRRRPPEDDQF